MDELKSKQKKEIKKFESEKRNALKKVKGTAGKGKKGKEALAAAEKELDETLKALLQKHKDEIASASGDADNNDDDNDDDDDTENKSSESPKIVKLSKEEEAKQKALAKRIRKRQNAVAKEKAREEEIAKELANAPDPRQMEIDAIMELYLNKSSLEIEEVAADGNCLYRAVAIQLCHLGTGTDKYDHLQMRKVCAEEIMERRDDYEPFADLSEMKVTTFEEYVDKVRESSEWGGHLELKALAHSLKKTIMVYSTEGPLEIKSGLENQEETEGDDDVDVIRLSFHRRYYALGEHYNSVVACKSE